MKQMRGKTLNWRMIGTVEAAVPVTLAAAGVASAATKITVDAGWQSFITGGGLDGASTAGPWVFSTSTVAKITVAAAFCRGDKFRVYDKDVLLGATSDVPSDFPACPFKLFFPADARADAALADPGFSHGVFFVGPGRHGIEFETKALWADTSTGTGAFFRVDTVAVGTADCNNGGWMNYGSLFKNQGQCVSLAI